MAATRFQSLTLRSECHYCPYLYIHPVLLIACNPLPLSPLGQSFFPAMTWDLGPGTWNLGQTFQAFGHIFVSKTTVQAKKQNENSRGCLWLAWVSPVSQQPCSAAPRQARWQRESGTF